MYVCLCVYTYVCMYACIYTRESVYIHVYTHTINTKQVTNL